ncbi:DivIVA domain-containing protein [Actinomyces oris]|uniref:DivIVA domain-containing protein n=1 Tax=Actinomyces oris TaxID=544580 RepID=UPI00094E42AC|nr:DivIVA domain-containing protein [Actinomyces oris]OLO56033.1 cell division protein DivIVA [Actinomyces oris]
MTLLTADDVLNVKFEVSSFKEGYDQDEVDEFLDEITTTMRELEERLGTSRGSSDPSHRRAESLLTSEAIRNIRFSTTRWSGYHIDQVDAFLAQVVSTMEALEAQARTSAFAGQPVTGAGAGGAYGGAYGGEAYGTSPAQTGYAPGAAGAGGAQYAEAIAQRDQYIAQLQQENAYLRAELEAAQRRLGTTGY